MPQLFTICREIMRSTDRLIARQAIDAKQSAPAGRANGAASPAEPPAIIWWHQIDDEDDTHEAQDVTAWVVTRDLVRARTQLMHSRGREGSAALEKLRTDFLLFARDAYTG